MAEPHPIVTYSKTAKFEDVRDDVKLAIEGKGLVIDYQSFVNRMLERTGKDVGSARKLYADVQAFVFCSAALCLMSGNRLAYFLCGDMNASILDSRRLYSLAHLRGAFLLGCAQQSRLPWRAGEGHRALRDAQCGRAREGSAGTARLASVSVREVFRGAPHAAEVVTISSC